jgi:hypothetical protein
MMALIRRAVANHLDDLISACAEEGHGHVSNDALRACARETLLFFNVSG